MYLAAFLGCHVGWNSVTPRAHTPPGWLCHRIKTCLDGHERIPSSQNTDYDYKEGNYIFWLAKKHFWQGYSYSWMALKNLKFGEEETLDQIPDEGSGEVLERLSSEQLHTKASNAIANFIIEKVKVVCSHLQLKNWKKW